MPQKKKWLVEAFKYGIVGIFNTLLTAVVIWLIMHLVFQLRGNESATATQISIANIIGYVVGLLNSFVWNRKWTFKSTRRWKKDFLRFIGAFLICYIPQLLLVMALNHWASFPTLQYGKFILTSGDLCQYIGIVFYTVLNFICNKFYTFKQAH
jgi:putative flippase GtrA